MNNDDDIEICYDKNKDHNEYKNEEYNEEYENKDRNEYKNEEYNEEYKNEEYTKKLKSKIDLIHINNGWNDKNERLLVSIGENAASYKWMHEASSNYYNTIYNITSITLIVLSSLLSIQTIFPNDTCNDSNNGVITIAKQIILYIVTILSFLQSFLNSQVLSQKHFFAAGLFSELYHDIQEQMCMFRKDRILAKQHVSQSLKKYDSLVVNNPDINWYVSRKFESTFGNKGISLPSIIDKIQKIQIITESDSEPSIENAINIKNLGNNPNLPSINHIGKSTTAEHRCHLAEINNVFQIRGDISDIELSYLKSKKFEHEYKRFLKHTREEDIV